MRLVSILLIFIVLFINQRLIDSTDDIRQRFEGLIGKSVQTAWNKIDREAPGRPMEVMRESSPKAQKNLTPGSVRVILSDRTGRVLYTPILEPPK